jgi:hypothetical protein
VILLTACSLLLKAYLHSSFSGKLPMPLTISEQALCVTFKHHRKPRRCRGLNSSLTGPAVHRRMLFFGFEAA